MKKFLVVLFMSVFGPILFAPGAAATDDVETKVEHVCVEGVNTDNVYSRSVEFPDWVLAYSTETPREDCQPLQVASEVSDWSVTDIRCDSLETFRLRTITSYEWVWSGSDWVLHDYVAEEVDRGIATQEQCPLPTTPPPESPSPDPAVSEPVDTTPVLPNTGLDLTSWMLIIGGLSLGAGAYLLFSGRGR